MGVGSVRGRFEEVEATVEIEDGQLRSAQAKIPVASINTRTEMRDNHLRSADFFDATNHPLMEFRSARIESQGDGTFKMTGDLTIRGTTRQVTLDGEMSEIIPDTFGGEARVGLTAEGTINRRDFGLNYNALLEAGGLVVADRVKLDIEVEAVKPKE